MHAPHLDSHAKELTVEAGTCFRAVETKAVVLVSDLKKDRDLLSSRTLVVRHRARRGYVLRCMALYLPMRRGRSM